MSPAQIIFPVSCHLAVPEKHSNLIHCPIVHDGRPGAFAEYHPSLRMAKTTQLPQLDLRRYPVWRKPFAALLFLPAALATIRNRQLHPSYTYHLLDRNESPVGLSAGDVCYLAGENDAAPINELVVALEDRRFFSHIGIDLRGVLRALRSNFIARRVVQGGSTITQQLVRNTLLTPDRSLTRKLLELLLALLIERHYSKHEILDLYSQLVYLGPGVRGFQAASRLIYRRSLSQLDAEAQCAIVGLLRRPSKDYPLTEQDSFRHRKAFIAQRLSGVVERIAMSKTLEKQSDPNPVSLCRLLKPRWTNVAQGLCAEAGVSLRNVKKLGLTLDRRLQAHLDRVLSAASRDPATESVAGVVLDNGTSDVLAETAWSEGLEGEFSSAFNGKLQPGSTFKPFALLAALEAGFGIDWQLLSAPFESSFIKNADGSSWRVRNYAFRYRGKITLADALRFSDNTAFARLVETLPDDTLQSVYERFGLATSGSVTPSIALGAVKNGVSLLQIASAYAAIARLGVYARPRLLRFVHYSDGTTWWPGPPRATTLVSNYSAIRSLHLALASTLPDLALLGFAGKTGSTHRGSLVAAYNDFVSAAIWVGYKRPRLEGSSKGVSALRVLERFVNEALLGHSRDPFSI